MALPSDFLETPTQARLIWSAALRSGRYERCHTFLGLLTPTGQYRHSSLGVACEEFRKRYSGRVQATEVVLAAAGYLCVEYRDGCSPADRFYLPDPVRCWLGLADTSGSLKPHYSHLGYGTVCELDDENIGFEKLADLVEAGALITLGDDDSGCETCGAPSTQPRGS